MLIWVIFQNLDIIVLVTYFEVPYYHIVGNIDGIKLSQTTIGRDLSI